MPRKRRGKASDAGDAGEGVRQESGCVDVRMVPMPEGTAGASAAIAIFVDWQVLSTLGVCLGEHVALSIGGADMPCAVLRAWASRKLGPGRAALTKRAKANVRASLGHLPPDVRLARAPWLVASPSQLSFVVSVEDALAGLELLRGCVEHACAGLVVIVGRRVAVPFHGRDVVATVGGAHDAFGTPLPRGTAVLVAAQTDVVVACEGTDPSPPSTAPAEAPLASPPSASPSLSQLGGLPGTVWEATTDLVRAVSEPLAYERLGLDPPRGCLIIGPPGAGASTLARAMATDILRAATSARASVESRLHARTAAQLVSDGAAAGASGPAAAITGLFDRAERASPAVVFIDDVDLIAAARTGSGHQTHTATEALAALLRALDGSRRRQGLVFLATTSRPEHVDAAVRRFGRVDIEVELMPPSAPDRRAILAAMVRGGAGQGKRTWEPLALREDELAYLADRAHGYVAADLESVLRHLLWTVDGQPAPAHGLRAAWLDSALRRVPPSALRDMVVEVPSVRWTDIGGQDHVRAALEEAVDWPLRHARLFERLGVRPPRGLLLYGPPGCSKTLTARALATESRFNFVAVKGPELFSKWVGESEKAVQRLFARARAAAPAIIFFDEIDALATRRGDDGSGTGPGGVAGRVLAQLLHELDGVETPASSSDAQKPVFVLAATNRPDLVDPALLRPGRFDRHIYVGLPDSAGREAVLRIHLRHTPTDPSVRVEELAGCTEGYTGAELAAVCRQAAMAALEDHMDIGAVHRAHFDVALQRVTPRTPGSLLEFYAGFRFGPPAGPPSTHGGGAGDGGEGGQQGVAELMARAFGELTVDDNVLADAPEAAQNDV